MLAVIGFVTLMAATPALSQSEAGDDSGYIPPTEGVPDHDLQDRDLSDRDLPDVGVGDEDGDLPDTDLRGNRDLSDRDLETGEDL
jgi:hypothetical protein